jgi:FkbH-like protein
MEAVVRDFVPADVPRIAQLVNKSNQFNLTTRRRTEAEVARLAESPEHACFTIRLADKFGDHGLIAVVVLAVGEETFIDTWLMSCRVLKRQVEEETTNEIVRLARLRGARAVHGLYLPTAKNDMVRGLLPSMGFAAAGERDGGLAFRLDVGSYASKPTHIKVVRA